MGRVARLKRERLKVGEIIEAEDVCGLLPRTRSRVVSVAGGMVFGAVGELGWGMPRAGLRVLRRGLPEPASWLPYEIRFIEGQVERCDCPDCRELLARKQAQFEREQSGEAHPGELLGEAAGAGLTH